LCRAGAGHPRGGLRNPPSPPFVKGGGRGACSLTLPLCPYSPPDVAQGEAHYAVDVLLAKFEHSVDQTGKFVGHRGNSFGRAKAGSEAPIVGAQGTLSDRRYSSADTGAAMPYVLPVRGVCYTCASSR
jgi:hypothetical protein